MYHHAVGVKIHCLGQGSCFGEGVLRDTAYTHCISQHWDLGSASCGPRGTTAIRWDKLLNLGTCPHLRVSGLGFMVEGLGSRVEGLQFRR